MNKLLIEFIEALLEGDLKEAPYKKVMYIEVTERMNVVTHTMCPLRGIIDTHEKMVIVMVEVTMSLPVIEMDTTLILQVVDVMFITTHLVMVASQIIHIDRLRKLLIL